jgi:hypothetical protein
LSYVDNSASGVPCPGLHHDVDDPGAAATKTAESHTARSVDCHLVIGTLLLRARRWDARSKIARSNLAVVKTLTYAMFAMTTDSAGIIIPEVTQGSIWRRLGVFKTVAAELDLVIGFLASAA